MRFTRFIALVLLLVGNVAHGQVTPGTSPLSGPKGGTNNAFMQFSGPASSLKTYVLPNASGTIAMLSQIQTWTAAQSFTNGGSLSGTFSGTPAFSGANFVTNGNLARMPAATLKGNPSDSTASASDFTIQDLAQKTPPDVNLDFVLLFDHVTNTFMKVTPAQLASSITTGVSSFNGLTGAVTGVTSVTVGGTTVTDTGTLPAVAFDAPQTLLIPQQAQAQSNVNLPDIIRRPVATWLPKWGAARAKVLAGTANATVLFIGDSTTAGVGAAPFLLNSWPTDVANLLTALGLNASSQSRIADNNLGATLPANDPRVVLGAYSTQPSLPTLAGFLFGASGTGSPFQFAPSTPVDSFDVYTITNGGLGTVNINVNGSAGTLVNEAGTAGLVKTTVTGPLGINTLLITPVSGSTFFLGAIAHNSAVKSIDVLNAGLSGGAAISFNDASTPWAALNAINTLAPVLTVIDLTINDAAGGVANATYQTNLQAVVTQAKVSGDVLLIGGVPVVPTDGDATLAKQAAINNMAAAVAAANSVNFISMTDLWTSRDAIIAAGYNADGIHLNAAGYAAMAAQITPHLQ